MMGWYERSLWMFVGGCVFLLVVKVAVIFYGYIATATPAELGEALVMAVVFFFGAIAGLLFSEKG